VVEAVARECECERRDASKVARHAPKVNTV
jgi:hypothetical protein